MKKYLKYLLLLGLIPALLLTGCKDDNDDDPTPVKTEYEQLTEYMVSNDLDLTDVLDGWVTTAAAINVDVTDYSVPDYYVIDLRKAEDFDAAHIKGAHNTTLADILAEAENAAGQPILVVCYTGQTAARAVGALRLMGFTAKSLKWGMSGWHADLAGKWVSNATDYAHTNWLDGGDPVANTEFGSPTLNTGGVDAADILRERVQAMLTMDWTISKTDLLDNPDNYFINNKWPIESWEAYGHVKGAYRIDEELNLNGLKYLDPNAEIVTYCYTGQTSAITTAWLHTLGYQGKSLMFGVNGINHSGLVAGTAGSAHKKSWGGEGSASENNFGYYDSEGNFFGPS